MWKHNEKIKKKVTYSCTKWGKKKDSMKVRIELQIFVIYSVKLCLQKIKRTLCELLIHQKTVNTKRLNVIWKKSFSNWKMKRSQIVSNNKRTIMKPAVLNLTGKTIDKNFTYLLSLGLNFVPRLKSIPCSTVPTWRYLTITNDI